MAEIFVGTIVKVAEEQRMVYGWASVVTEKGVPVVDLQGDIIPANVMERATTEFMASARMAKAMHAGGGIGEVLHSFPVTDDIVKSLGLASDREGWIVGVKIHDDEVWKRVKSGELGGFSIGGKCSKMEIENA